MLVFLKAVSRWPDLKKYDDTDKRFALFMPASILNSTHVRQSKTVLGSAFHAMDSGYFQKIDSRGTWRLHWIPILSRIPDSLSCIPDSKVQDPGIHTQKFPGFWNKDSLNTWWSPIRLPGKLKNLHLPLLYTSSFSVYRQKRTMMQKALRRVDNFVQIYKAHWSCMD